MNKQRRKAIDEIVTVLESQRDDIESLKGEEQDVLDQLPENMRDGEKGQAMQEAIDSLDEAQSNIDSALNILESVT